MISRSIEIERPQQEVFDYLDRFDLHHEWQEQIVSTRIDSAGPVAVGTRVTDVRRLPAGGGTRAVSFEVVEHDPPRRTSFRVLEGPVRARGTFVVEQAGEGRSRVTLELEFEGRGLGRALLPLVRREAERQVPKDQRRLKERLEAGV